MAFFETLFDFATKINRSIRHCDMYVNMLSLLSQGACVLVDDGGWLSWRI